MPHDPISDKPKHWCILKSAVFTAPRSPALYYGGKANGKPDGPDFWTEEEWRAMSWPSEKEARDFVAECFDHPHMVVEKRPMPAELPPIPSHLIAQ